MTKGLRIEWSLQGGPYHGVKVRLSAGVSQTLKSPAGFYREDKKQAGHVMVWVRSEN